MSPTPTLSATIDNSIINYVPCTDNDVTQDTPSSIFKSFSVPETASPGSSSPPSPVPISPILSPTYPLNSPLNSAQPSFLLPPASAASHAAHSDAKPPLPHPCDSCNATFGDKRMLSLHKRVTHEHSSLLRCLHCTFVFGDAHQLNTHILTYHRDGSHCCTRCTAVFSSRALLKQHVKQHDMIAEMRALSRCDFCEFTTQSAGEMRFHISDKHPGEDENAVKQRKAKIMVLRGTGKFRLRADSAPVGKENQTNINTNGEPPKLIRRSKGAFFLRPRSTN